MSDLPANSVEAVVLGVLGEHREHFDSRMVEVNGVYRSVDRCWCGWFAADESHAAHQAAAVAAAMQERRDGVSEGLSEAERQSLFDAATERLGRMPSSNPWDYVHALIPHIERILADRSARTPTLADEGLAGKVRALADEWESWSKGRTSPRIDAFRDAAEALRALLADDAPKEEL